MAKRTVTSANNAAADEADDLLGWVAAVGVLVTGVEVGDPVLAARTEGVSSASLLVDPVNFGQNGSEGRQRCNSNSLGRVGFGVRVERGESTRLDHLVRALAVERVALLTELGSSLLVALLSDFGEARVSEAEGDHLRTHGRVDEGVGLLLGLLGRGGRGRRGGCVGAALGTSGRHLE